MAKVTVVKEKNYTTIDNGIFKDTRISFKAKGLLTTMLSLPPTWNYTIEGLATLSKDGRDSIKTALKELENFGYLERKQVRNDNGSFCDLEYFVYEKPQPKEPLAENPPADKSSAENHRQLSTDISSTDKSNTDKENTKRLNTDDKYALKDVKKSSFKGNMYSSVPEEQEAAAPKKQSRYIPKDYTEEQLRKHIKPVVENEVKQYIEDMDVKIPDDRAKTFSDILCLFCRKYKLRFGENHYVMPDKTVKSAVRRYLEPPEEMDGTFDVESYEELIDLYFKTDFNKIGKFKDENGNKKKVVLSFSHFMSDTIRGNLANRLWK